MPREKNLLCRTQKVSLSASHSIAPSIIKVTPYQKMLQVKNSAVVLSVLVLLLPVVVNSVCPAGQFGSGNSGSTKPSQSVSCQLTIDNTLGPMTYNGVSIGSGSNSWWTTKTISFITVPNAALVIEGYDWEGGNSGHCRTAGFAMRCTSADSFWSGFSTANKAQIQAQGGTTVGCGNYGGTNGWCPPSWGPASTPCTTTSGFYLSVASGTAKIWAPAGQRYGRFTIVDPNNAQTFTCSNCPVGTYQNVNSFAGTSCKPCEVGYYQDQTGPDCKVCATGTVQPATGQMSCSACPAGQNQASTGRTTCPACLAGRYQSEEGQSSCPECTTGKYQGSTLQVTCDNCQNGRFMDETGAVACKACAVGQAAPSKGQSSCDDCSIGQYQDGTSAISCKNCDSGEYQANTKQSGCLLCSIGRFQSGAGGSSCPGQCDCGYYCPAGSANGSPEVCGEGNWCPPATTTRNALGANMQGTPVGTNLARFCGQQACPYGFACKDGEARPNMQFNAPAACKSNSPDAPYIVQIDEDQTLSSFGAQFKVDVSAEL